MKDYANTLASGLSLALGLGATLGPSVIDLTLGSNLRDAASGTAPLALEVEIGTAVTSGGSGTLDVQLLANATDPTFSASNIVLLDYGVIAYTTLAAKYVFPRLVIPRQALNVDYEHLTSLYRYITLNLIVGTAALTGGTLNARIQPLLMGTDVGQTVPANYTSK